MKSLFNDDFLSKVWRWIILTIIFIIFQKFSFHSRFHVKTFSFNLFSCFTKNYKIRPTGENDCEKTQHIKYRTQTESCRMRREFSKDFFFVLVYAANNKEEEENINFVNWEKVRGERKGSNFEINWEVREFITWMEWKREREREDFISCERINDCWMEGEREFHWKESWMQFAIIFCDSWESEGKLHDFDEKLKFWSFFLKKFRLIYHFY